MLLRRTQPGVVDDAAVHDGQKRSQALDLAIGHLWRVEIVPVEDGEVAELSDLDGPERVFFLAEPGVGRSASKGS